VALYDGRATEIDHLDLVVGEAGSISLREAQSEAAWHS